MPPDATEAMKIVQVNYGKEISGLLQLYDSLTKTEVNTDLVLHPSLVLQVVSECVCINKCIIYNFMNEVYSKSYEKSEWALVFLLPA